MSALNNRDKLESDFARRLAKAHARIADDLLAYMGEKPDYVTQSQWDDIARQLTQIVTPELETIYMAGANALTTAVQIGVDIAVVNQRAADFARTYGFDLVRNINANSQAILRAAVGDYFEERVTLGTLQERITRTFGPVRSAQIAITETTRAAVEGERGMIGELTAQGVKLYSTWVTVSDGVVCPVCESRNRQPVETVGYPPAHPGCRCTIATKVKRDE